MKPLVALIIIVLVAIGGYAFYTHKAAAPVIIQNSPVVAPAQTQPSAAQDTGIAPPATAPAGKTVTITYTDSGFTPKAADIAIGDTVKFVNSSTHGMWVASDVHPSHTKYDGTSLMQHCKPGATASFDECSPGAAGASYSFTFTKAGAWTFHNHVRASDAGTVTVK